MTYDPNIHHRRSVRLKGYDYALANPYFITGRAMGGRCVFGRVIDGKAQMNRFGRIIAEELLNTPTVRPSVELDEWIVMPNHFHAILVLTVSSPHPEPRRGQRPRGPAPGSIGAILAQLKSVITKRIIEMRGQPTEVWQRSFHDRIIRDQFELDNKRRYIYENPQRWRTTP